MKRAILWFRNDLRLYDNPTLEAAVQENEEIIPVYILDERYLGEDRWGFVRTAPFRLQFQIESLLDLHQYLAEKGSGLLFRKGIPEEILPQLAEEYDASTIYASKEYTHEEIQVEDAISNRIPLQLFHNSTLFHPDDLPFAADQVPDVFTQFRKRVEKYAKVRELIPSPEAIHSPDLDYGQIPSLKDLKIDTPKEETRQVLTFKGGALAAENRLEHYFWETDAVATYKETRNGLIGANYSTKFSPWLTNGCISARTIYHEVDAYEAEVEANQSTYWVKFELLWRDYFKFVAMKYGRKIFFKGGIQNKQRNSWQNEKKFWQWAEGRTGDAFVDANMRELLQTGFMSNRGRQNVASYLVHQMNLDWRMGAAWFESLLIDYDVTSNYGNWMYAAGVGNDPRDRVFNTKRQASMYDGDGAYRDLWLKKAKV